MRGVAHGVQDRGRIRVRGSYVDVDAGRCCSKLPLEQSQSSMVLVLLDSVLGVQSVVLELSDEAVDLLLRYHAGRDLAILPRVCHPQGLPR